LDKKLREALEVYRGQKGAVIPVLQKVQQTLGYLPEDIFPEVAKLLKMSKNEVYGVATFYAQFRFERPGKHSVKCCQGTACYVQGSRLLMDAVRDELKVPGDKSTTDDYEFSVESVACFGSCALAPVMVVDDDVHGRMTTSKVKEVLAGTD